MKIEDFKKMKVEEKVEVVNNRLQELKTIGKTTKEFRSEKLEFSYATVIKEMDAVGYARNGSIFEKEVKLTEREISVLKNLTYGYEFMMRKTETQPKIVRRQDDQFSTTSVRVYNKVWKRWQCFTNEWSIFNSVDLMATALEEYMDKHCFEDYDTLVEDGKIKDGK